MKDQVKHAEGLMCVLQASYDAMRQHGTVSLTDAEYAIFREQSDMLFEMFMAASEYGLELDQVQLRESLELFDGMWLHYAPGCAAHLYLTPGERSVSVLMKVQRLKPRCKRKTLLQVLSRTTVSDKAAALAWADLEARRLGWL